MLEIQINGRIMILSIFYIQMYPSETIGILQDPVFGAGSGEAEPRGQSQPGELSKRNGALGKATKKEAQTFLLMSPIQWVSTDS